MKRNDQKQIMVRVDENTRTKLKIKVLQENTSIQEVLEKAIHEYLNSDKDK
jgi:predicted HicB family RNase H-like nuclease|nr:MAG TPA: antitoxin [Caudoviricetes sp.]DAW25001.1 MAG TPA: antitoxin [Caudoviricetes sp.]